MNKRCPHCYSKEFTVHTTEIFEYTELFRGVSFRHCSYMRECHMCDLKWYIISLPECTKCYRAFMYDKNKTLKINCSCEEPDLEYTLFWFHESNKFSPIQLDNNFYILEQYPPPKYIQQPISKTCTCSIM